MTSVVDVPKVPALLIITMHSDFDRNFLVINRWLKLIREHNKERKAENSSLETIQQYNFNEIITQFPHFSLRQRKSQRKQNFIEKIYKYGNDPNESDSFKM